MSLVARNPSAVNTTFTHTTGAAEANLYDGNDATSAADPAGLTTSTKAAYDLGGALNIVQCRAITAASNGFTNATTFNIAYSDTSLTTGFTNASTIVVPAGTGQVAIAGFASVGAHKYWRIAYASGTTGGNAWLGELTFYTSDAADAGAFTETGNTATFKVSEAAGAASYGLTGSAALLTHKMPSSAGAYAETGMAALFAVQQAAAAGSYSVTGAASLATSVLPATGGSVAVTFIDQPLTRTGDDYDFKLGGIGHLLEEIERQKRLNAITRKIPVPVDRRTVPRFEPLQGPPVAPPAAAPDMAAIQNQRMAEAAAQTQRAQKRRRDEEALLLLAS